MALRKGLATTQAEAMGITVISGDGDQQVIKGAYASLADAVKDIVGALREGEKGKLKIVTAIDQISKLELYTQEGFSSMAAYMPKLIEQCNEVSWNSGSSIKRYLTWYRLYVLLLGYNPDEALKAVSHLGILARLADINRKSGELAEDDNLAKAKLGKVKFDDLGRLVTQLVNGFPNEVILNVLGAARVEELRREAKAPAGATPKQVVAFAGLNGMELVSLLEAVKLGATARTYEGVTGKELVLPPKRWTVGHTQAIVDALVKAEDETEDEEDAAAEVEQVFVGYETHDGAVMVERIEWRGQSGTVLETIEVGKVYTTSMFKKLLGKATAAIAGVDGEQGDA